MRWAMPIAQYVRTHLCINWSKGWIFILFVRFVSNQDQQKNFDTNQPAAVLPHVYFESDLQKETHFIFP